MGKGCIWLVGREYKEEERRLMKEEGWEEARWTLNVREDEKEEVEGWLRELRKEVTERIYVYKSCGQDHNTQRSIENDSWKIEVWIVGWKKRQLDEKSEWTRKEWAGGCESIAEQMRWLNKEEELENIGWSKEDVWWLKEGEGERMVMKVMNPKRWIKVEAEKGWWLMRRMVEKPRWKSRELDEMKRIPGRLKSGEGNWTEAMVRMTIDMNEEKRWWEEDEWKGVLRRGERKEAERRRWWWLNAGTSKQ